jgi:CheY-like chemotaxis protein
MQKVLIAEDSKTIREILGGILAREGYEIMKAPMTDYR